jgi:hypothetical protein
MAMPLTRRHWFAVAERGAIRLGMITLGTVMMIVGLALGVTMIMLPAGLVIGLTGAGVTLWGAVGDVPIDG